MLAGISVDDITGGGGERMKKSVIIFGTFVIALLMFSTSSCVLSEKTYGLSSVNSNKTVQNNKIIESLEGPERILFGRFTDVSGSGYLVPIILGGEYDFHFGIGSFYIYTQGDGSVTINGKTWQGDYKYTVRGFFGLIAFNVDPETGEGFAWGRAILIKIEKYTP